MVVGAVGFRLLLRTTWLYAVRGAWYLEGCGCLYKQQVALGCSFYFFIFVLCVLLLRYDISLSIEL